MVLWISTADQHGPPPQPVRPPPKATSTAWGLDVEDLFHHVVAVPARPRLPRGQLRGGCVWNGRASRFRAGPTAARTGQPTSSPLQAARGRELAALLDSDTPRPRRHRAAPRRPRQGAPCALRSPPSPYPSTTGGGNMTSEDFALTVGWGHFGQGEAVMPGRGRVVRAPLHRIRARRPGRSRPHTRRHRIRPKQPSQDRQPANHARHASFHQPDRRGDRQNGGDTRRHHVRHLPERPGLLAKRPSRRLELQARRLPGPQEVALLPRKRHPRPPPQTRGSPALHQHRPPHHRNIGSYR